MIFASKEIIKQLSDHARECYPEECCGVFKCNKLHDDDLEIVEIFKTKNVSRHKKTGAQLPKRFFKKFSQLARVHKRLNMVYGVYHSHPMTGTLMLSDQDVFSSTLFKLFKRQIIIGIRKSGRVKKIYWENKQDKTWVKTKITKTRYQNEHQRFYK